MYIQIHLRGNYIGMEVAPPTLACEKRREEGKDRIS
jgi:hypothetical protein